MRCVAWLALIVLYLLHVKFTGTLFKSVAFVAVISLYANAFTDFGQGCASLAQLSAEDAHADTEHVRASLQIDTAAIESDIAKLAELQPGPEATSLAAAIRARLVGE